MFRLTAVGGMNGFVLTQLWLWVKVTFISIQSCEYKEQELG